MSQTKYAVVILSFLFLPGQIFPQWEPIHPYPLVDRSFVFSSDSEICNVISQKGNLITSLDGGISWEYKYFNLNLNIQKVFFLDDKWGWALSGWSILKTEDGGLNWVDKGDIYFGSHNDIFFLDTLRGWVIGYSNIRSTTDGGESWDNLTLPDSPFLRFIALYNDSVLFAGGRKLYRTTNLGETWIEHPNPLTLLQYANFISVDNVGLLVGDYYNIVRTTDAGNSWELVFPNSGFYLINEMKHNNGMIITCGRDRVLKTTNYGDTWDSVTVPYANYHTIYFATDSIIYISGDNGALIKSTDRGNSFYPLFTNYFNKSIHSVSFTDSLNGYVIFNNESEVYRTSDGGKSFIDVTPPGIYQPAHFLLAITEKMAALVSDVRIYITKDAGVTWNYSSYGPMNTYCPTDIYFKDTLNAIAVCGWNLIRETINGGESWANRFMGTSQEHLVSITFPEPEIGYYSSEDKLYKSTNGGVDWYYVSTFNEPVKKVRFISVNEGIASGFNLYYTVDGGVNWTIINNIGYVSSFDLKKNGSGSVLSAISHDSLHISYDLAFSWEKRFIPFTGLVNLHSNEPSTSWLSGHNGSIIKFQNDNLPSSVISQNYFSSFYLSQNYPNPFNPSTKISWLSPVGSWQTLKLFDVLGREVATLVDEYRDAGYHEVEFLPESSTKHPASGIYFYQLKSGSYIETKKMIYLK